MGGKAAEENVLTYNVAMNWKEPTSNFFSWKGVVRWLNKIFQIMRLHEHFHLEKDTATWSQARFRIIVLDFQISFLDSRMLKTSFTKKYKRSS